MSQFSKPSDRVKSPFEVSLEKFATTLRADFRFAPLNAFVLIGIFVVGMLIHLQLASPDSMTTVVSLYLDAALILPSPVAVFCVTIAGSLLVAPCHRLQCRDHLDVRYGAGER